MYQVFAQKYRPQKFNDVIGQEAAVRTIENAVLSGRLANAYIFCGPRGVGKTSIARLIAKIINCDNPEGTSPCNKCTCCEAINRGSSMDVLEIDGASNRGIDEIRTLRENVKFKPSGGRYKVYIIDEVHMLTPEAFNALLKTLEEPPGHVKFIFATTEPHKVLATILSRCQRFDFKRIPPRMIFDRIIDISLKEKIDIDDKAALFIARSADGSLRDALVILDQMVSFTENRITPDDVLDLLGMVHREVVFELSDAVILKQSGKVAGMLDEIINSGKDPVFVLNNLISHFRDLLILKSAGEPTQDMAFHEDELKLVKAQSEKLSMEELLYIMDSFSHCFMLMKGTMYTRVPLEVALLKLTKRDSILAIDEILKRLERLEASGGRSPKGTVPSKMPEGNTTNYTKSPQQPLNTPANDTPPNANEPRTPNPETRTPNPETRTPNPETRTPNPETRTPNPETRTPNPETRTPNPETRTPNPEPRTSTPPAAAPPHYALTPNTAHWDQVLNYIKNKKYSIYTFIKQAKPLNLTEKKVTLAFDKDHAFNKDVLEIGDNVALIKEACKAIFDYEPVLEIKILDSAISREDDLSELKKKQEGIRKTSNPSIETAMDVFGGKIVRDQID